MEIEKICRTCLSLNGPLLSIYDSSSGSEGCVADMLSSFTKTKPKRADKLPEKVCLACISEINRSYSFKLKCENSNRTLRQLLPDAPPEEIEDVPLSERKPVVQFHRYVQTTPEARKKPPTKTTEMQTDAAPPRATHSQQVQTEARLLNDIATSPIIETPVDDGADKRTRSKRIKLNDSTAAVTPAKEKNNFRQVKAPTQRSGGRKQTIVTKRYHMEKNEHDGGEIILELLDVVDEAEKDGGNTNTTTAHMDDENATYYEITAVDMAESIPVRAVKHEEPQGGGGGDDDQEEAFDDDDDTVIHQMVQSVTRKRAAPPPSAAIDDQDSLDTDINFTIFDKDGETQIVQNRRTTRQMSSSKASGRLELKCPECIMTFVSEKNLRRHMIKRHSWTEDALKSGSFEIVPAEKTAAAGATTPNASSEQATAAQPASEKILLKTDQDEDDEFDDVDDSHDDAVDAAVVSKAKHYCVNCNAVFAARKSLSYHLKQNVCALQSFKCTECERVFISEENLKEHMITHTMSNTCSQCFVAFGSVEELSQHMVRDHNRKMRNQCNVCKKVFTMASALKDHLRIHSGEKPFLCPKCGKAFSQNANLKQHVMRHANEKNFKCDICSHSFVTKAELYSHKRMHTGDTPYSCDFCVATFSTSSSLLKHRRKHTGERPYACDICPMRFAALNVLKNHRRTHTGEKPYKCEYCRKRFTQKGDCKTHQRTHELTAADDESSMNKTFTCFCGKEFQDLKSFRIHNKHYHHAEKQPATERRTRSSGGGGGDEEGLVAKQQKAGSGKQRSMRITIMGMSDESNAGGEGEVLTVATDDEMPIGSGDDELIEMAIDLC